VLFERRLWAGLADGSVTLAFRRWRRPRARPGARHRTPAGVLEIDTVEPVEEDSISEQEAHAAGYTSLADLRRSWRRREGTLYRIAFHHAGPDPRLSLREADHLSAEEWHALRARLARLDARPSGAWTARVLRLIEARPATLAAELAAELGREKLPFKADVRRLKELGLTESLRPGYRLSPRGRAVLRRLEADHGAEAAAVARR
jgi:hypothetical protein